MANEHVGSGYDQSIGTRNIPGQAQTEFYNTQTQEGSSDPNALSAFVNQNFQGNTDASNVFNVIKGAYTPVKSNPSPIVPSSTLNTPPATNFDVQSLIQQNTQRQDDLLGKILGLYQPDPAEQALLDKANKASDTLQNFDISVEGGIKDIMNKPQVLDYQQGQQAALMRDSAFTRSSLNREYDTAIRALQNAQATRGQKLEAAKFLYDANRNSLQDTIAIYKSTAPENLSTKVDEATGNVLVFTRNPITGEVTTKQAGNVRVTMPFYKFDNDPTVYTKSGQPLPDKQAYLAAGGAGDWGDVQTIDITNAGDKLLTPTEAARLGVPYGTTQQQAAAQNITPSFGKTSTTKKTTVKTIPIGTANKYNLPTDTPKEDYDFVLNGIQEAKRSAPTLTKDNYFEVWGQVTDWLEANNLDPSLYDAVLWEELHPEGLAGYLKYVGGKGKSDKRSL